MKVINYFKIKKYIKLLGKTEQEFLTMANLSNDYLRHVEYGGVVTPANVKKIAAVLNVIPAQLTSSKTTLEDVLFLLVDLSWTNNMVLDRDHIVHHKLKDMELTQAECILLYEGTQTGVADCTVQPHIKYECAQNCSGH
jgi:transcriptional regulator with XRE-family HTH domain